MPGAHQNAAIRNQKNYQPNQCMNILLKAICNNLRKLKASPSLSATCLLTPLWSPNLACFRSSLCLFKKKIFFSSLASGFELFHQFQFACWQIQRRIHKKGRTMQRSVNALNNNQIYEYILNLDPKRQKKQRQVPQYLKRLIPTIPYCQNASLLKDKINLCVICQAEFQTHETVKLLRCGHIYHESCLDSWLDYDRVCCICKDDIF